MKFRSVDAFLLDERIKENCLTNDLLKAGAGAFCWGTRGDSPGRTIWLVLPIEDELYKVLRLRVSRQPENDPDATVSPVWGWDGDKIKPTLSPSIRHHGGVNRAVLWHGFLKSGRLEACE